jgi:hypothetical protein
LRESSSGFAIEWDVDEFVQRTELLLTDENLWINFHEKGLHYVQDYDWGKLFERWQQEIVCQLEKLS